MLLGTSGPSSHSSTAPRSPTSAGRWFPLPPRGGEEHDDSVGIDIILLRLRVGMEDPAHMLLTGVLSLFLQSLKFRAHWAWVLLDVRLPASWHPHHLKCFGSLASGLVTAELLGRETPSVTSSLMLKLQRSRTHAHAGGTASPKRTSGLSRGL